MKLVTKTVLITVKAPPNPSKKYQETNCCAGIEIDTGKWIRLYPIPFRLLNDYQQFPKYSIISVACTKPLRDKRIESYKIDQDSIEILRQVGTRNSWDERKSIVLPTLSSSFCEILEEVKHHKSLGIFKPDNIVFKVGKTVSKDKKKRQVAYKQHHLFDKTLKPLEEIPFSFYYEFKCHRCPTCNGHKLMIHDWELTQAYRSWRHKYEDKNLLLNKIEEKWLHNLCSCKNDVYFCVGNVWRRPKQFMVLGVFYPPKSLPTLFT